MIILNGHALTVAEKYKPPMLADFTSAVILLFSTIGILLLRKINPSGEEKFG